MVSRHPKAIILTYQDDLPQMLGRHPDLTHESDWYNRQACRAMASAPSLDASTELRRCQLKANKLGGSPQGPSA